MNEDKSKRRLGRGLAALIGDMDQPAMTSPSADRYAPIEAIAPNPRNPRCSVDDEALDDLAKSIDRHGVVQPVLVRPAGERRYEIVAGERRWRAARRAGLAEIPVIVRDCDDRKALELALVENVQRADLNPIDEAEGYRRLIAEYDYSQNDLGAVVGKSRSHVANCLRLLKLPESVKRMLAAGTLAAGHARAIAKCPDPARLARRIVAHGMSVRDAERLARDREGGPDGGSGGGRPAAGKGKPPAVKDADTLALEKMLTDSLGLNVSIVHRSPDGHVKVEYRTLEQLDALCRLLRTPLTGMDREG